MIVFDLHAAAAVVAFVGAGGVSVWTLIVTLDPNIHRILAALRGEPVPPRRLGRPHATAHPLPAPPRRGRGRANHSGAVMMPRNVDYLRQQRERSHARLMRIVVGAVGFFWLLIALGLIWLIRHPREVGEFFGLLAAGFGMDR